MTEEFIAHPEPPRDECEELAQLFPGNPFCRYELALAERALSGRPWLLAMRAGGRIQTGCLGFIGDSISERTLSVPSVPSGNDAFWEGLRKFCILQGVTVVRLNSYASSLAVLPVIGQELQRFERCEFILPLTYTDESELLGAMSSTHRRLVRKAAKAGLVLRTDLDAESLSNHLRLTGASFDRRRARGEDVPTEIAACTIDPYLRSGWCRLFQVVDKCQVVSSMTIAIAQSSAYLHTSGSSAAGMATGASHFLVFEIAKLLRGEGVDEFNLGGVVDRSSGLARYKSSFGCRAVESEAVVSRVGGRAARLRHSSSRLMNKALNVLLARIGSSAERV